MSFFFFSPAPYTWPYSESLPICLLNVLQGEGRLCYGGWSSLVSQTPVKEVVLHLPRGHLRHISYIIGHTDLHQEQRDGRMPRNRVCFITFDVAEIKGSSVFFLSIKSQQALTPISKTLSIKLQKQRQVRLKSLKILTHSVVCWFLGVNLTSDAAAGVFDLLQQRGRRSPERHRGVQVPVCVGPLELPRESSAAVHAQQSAQRWVPPETSAHRSALVQRPPPPFFGVVTSGEGKINAQ